MKDMKSALMAMRALRKHANMMKLKGNMKADVKDANAATAEGSDPLDQEEPLAENDGEDFEPYKPYKPTPVSEKMTLIVSGAPKKEPNHIAQAIDAVEGKVKRGPGRPRKS